MKILVVDDSPGDVNLLQQAFRELNSRALLTVAKNGDECFEMLYGKQKFAERLPDLIFLDLELPTVSGYDVLRRIKGDEHTRHIPVIVISAASEGAAVEGAYAAHANAFVRKPTSLAELITAARGLKSFWMDTARLSSLEP